MQPKAQNTDFYFRNCVNSYYVIYDNLGTETSLKKSALI